MLNNEIIDILSICTPEFENLNIFQFIANSNINIKAIFCEKPVSTSSTNIAKIKEICEKNDIVLSVNYMRRWEKKFTNIKNIINSGEFGELLSINAYGSTALMTSASHLIDLSLFFGGKPEWIIGSLQSDYIRNVRGHDDPGGTALIKLENDAFCYLKATSKNERFYMFELDIFLTGGRISISNDGQKIEFFSFKDVNSSIGSGYNTLEKINKDFGILDEERMLIAIDDTIDCIIKKTEPKSNIDNALCALKVIEKIKESSNNSNSKVFF
tara:strand:+ start:22576 stop:23385 length:810 start_codon:yes stop_codon:yes gene_type:complete